MRPPQAAVRRQRRDTFLFRILPLLLALLVVGLALVMVLALPKRAQVSIVADWMFSVLMLCPLAVCGFPLALLGLVSVFGMARVTGLARRPVRRLEGLTLRVAERTASVSDDVNRRVAGVSARLAPLEGVLDALMAGRPAGEEKELHDDDAGA